MFSTETFEDEYDRFVWQVTRSELLPNDCWAVTRQRYRPSLQGTFLPVNSAMKDNLKRDK